MRISDWSSDVCSSDLIISFSTPSAIVHDHFIEVKSFSGRRRFFWTRNEMETASRLGEAYHLCIVDRDRIYHSDYSPEIISGPYAALIETDDNGWLISPTTFECVGIDGWANWTTERARGPVRNTMSLKAKSEDR